MKYPAHTVLLNPSVELRQNLNYNGKILVEFSFAGNEKGGRDVNEFERCH